MSIIWCEEWNLGYEAIDNQHKDLLNIINLVNEEDINYCVLIHLLQNYLSKHFNVEERLMLIIDYPKDLYMEHKKEHMEFTLTILEASFEVVTCSENNKEIFEGLKDFCMLWFNTHFLNTDKKLTDFMHNIQSAEKRGKLMDRTVLIDTNLYLDDHNIIDKLSMQYSKVLIPVTVLKELDKKKYHKDLAYSARSAIRAILDFTSEHKDNVIFDVTDYPEHDPDSKILASAAKYSATLATKDISMSIIAKSMNIDTMIHDAILNNIYDPYIHINMSDLYDAINESTFSFSQEYKDTDYEALVKALAKISNRDLNSDNWWFVIINVNKDNPIVYANNPIKTELVRIDNRPEFREIKTDGSTVKARDCYQICAIYALEEAPHVLISGPYGSGKSLLSTAYSLKRKDRKTFVSRPNLTIDRRYELGFLPGLLKDKLSPWMSGFISSLYHLYSNTKGQSSDKMTYGVSYDYVKEQVFEKYFEMVSLETLQGMSFMEGDLLMLDETQLCSISILSLILSRFGKGSKLVMTGDTKQTYGVVPPSENGLLKLLRLLPNKELAYVDLKYNYRSKLLELADELQNKSF